MITAAGVYAGTLMEHGISNYSTADPGIQICQWYTHPSLLNDRPYLALRPTCSMCVETVLLDPTLLKPCCSSHSLRSPTSSAGTALLKMLSRSSRTFLDYKNYEAIKHAARQKHYSACCLGQMHGGKECQQGTAQENGSSCVA